jgi:hypothetical protein
MGLIIKVNGRIEKEVIRRIIIKIKIRRGT